MNNNDALQFIVIVDATLAISTTQLTLFPLI